MGSKHVLHLPLLWLCCLHRIPRKESLSWCEIDSYHSPSASETVTAGQMERALSGRKPSFYALYQDVGVPSRVSARDVT